MQINYACLSRFYMSQFGLLEGWEPNVFDLRVQKKTVRAKLDNNRV